MIKRIIGFYYIKIKANRYNVLLLSKRLDIELYDINESKGFIYFYIPAYYLYKIKSLEDYKIITSTGVVGFYNTYFKNIVNLIGLLIFLCSLVVSSMFIYGYEIKGDYTRNNKVIKNEISKLGYNFPMMNFDYEILKNKLVDKIDNISWIEMYDKNGKLIIKYLSKNNVEGNKDINNNLYATKDGMVVHFDLIHGEKQVNVNDVVKKGDLLVSNILLDSYNKAKELRVKGRVFAYTWKDVSVEFDDTYKVKAVAYYKALLLARNEVSKEIDEGEKIIEENILHFDNKLGKIMIRVHYTLYEDISTP